MPPRSSTSGSVSARSARGATTQPSCGDQPHPGNAGRNHTGDHVDVLRRASPRSRPVIDGHLLVRADAAGAIHEPLDWLTSPTQVGGRRLEYWVGFTRTRQRHCHHSKAGVDGGGEIREGR
jgi:hypothetical protein